MLAVATAWHCWSDQPAAIPCGSHTAQPPCSSGSGAGAWEGLTGAALKGKIFSEREKSHPHTEKAKSHLREGFCQQRGCARNFGRAFNFTPGLAKGKNSRL